MHINRAAKVIIVSHAVVLALAIGWKSVEARPSAEPTAGNIAAPLYTDSRADTKAGALTVSNTLTATTLNVSGAITTQSLCLPGGGCLNYWPNLNPPNYGLQDVLYPTNGAIQNRWITLGSITLGGSYRSTWPSWSGSTYGSSYWAYAGGGFGYCNSDYYMAGVSYLSGGGLSQIWCVRINLQ